MSRSEPSRQKRLAARPGRLAALALLLVIALPTAARAQWATNGNNINNTNTGNVGVGTASPDTNAKLHVYNAPNVGMDIQSANGGGWSRLRLMTRTHVYGWFTGDSSQPDAPDKIGLYDYTAGAFRMMVDSSGNLGIGTSSPGRRLEVLAPDGEAARLYRNAANVGWGVNIVFAFNNSNNVRTDYAGVHGVLANPAAGAEAGHLVFTTKTNGTLTEKMRIDNTGNVGVGTAGTAYARLSVNKSIRIDDDSGSLAGSDTIGAGPNLYFGTVNGGAVFQWNAAGGLDLWHYVGGWTRPFTFSKGGNLGIGTNNPAARLDVNGDILVSGNINAKYQDVAEWVPSAQKLRAGTVVVLDPAKTNHVVASTSAYDTSVAGVVSERPGIALGEAGEGKLLVATTGRVRVRVDATLAPVRVGDLLVTSDREGAAMRSEPVVVGGRKMHAPGTIIGKALEPLEKGVGEILVLLSLQ